MARRTRRYKTRKNKRGGVNKRTRKNKRKKRNMKKKKSRKSKETKELNLEKLINMSHKARESHKAKMPKKKNLPMRAPASPLPMNKNKIKQHLLSNNFDKNDKVFVMIHANWCPHCTEALPKFMEARKIVNNDSKYNVLMEEYESDEYPELKNIASGYPTFLEIVNNKIKKYEGPREVDDLVSECRNL